MAGRSPKPIKLLKGHRSKAEKKKREESEKAMLSGFVIQEWDDVKNNVLAHKEFARIKKILKKINHDDALYESVINRKCLLEAECKQSETEIKELREDLQELHLAYQESKIEFMQYLSEKGRMQDRMITWDKKVMDKRKMLLQIEKENIMTIMSALRSVPKKQEEKKETDPMAALLGG
jgi:hypothetical protein